MNRRLVVLLTLSASHHDLDLDLLEQLSTGAQSVGPTVVADSSIAGCVVLATCNRFEVYLDTDRDVDVAVKAATSTVAQAAGFAPGHAKGLLRLTEGTGPVARHLFAVAAGLDSMVVGEREVAGQVRRALAAARADRTMTASLELLFQTASRASRSVGAHTGLGTAGRSVVAVALDLAAERLTLTGANVLLIGTGSYARAAVSALRARGVGRIAVHSPSGRAAAFASERSLIPIDAGALADHLADADLVVACSGATGPVLGVEEVSRARHRTDGHRPMVLVDLALRHDIDSAVGGIPGVTLLDLAGVQAGTPATAPEVGDGWGIIETHVERLAAALAERDLVPAVVALREHVHALLDAELARAGGSPEVERALTRLAASLLHTPMVRARTHARRGDSQVYLDALATLFDIAPDEPR